MSIYSEKYNTILNRPDGSRLKIKPYLDTHVHERGDFEWSFELFYSAPGTEDFIEVSDEYIDGGVDVTEEEILQANLRFWEGLRPL